MKKNEFPILGNHHRKNFQPLELTLVAAILFFAGAARAAMPEIELSELAKGFDHPLCIVPSRDGTDRFFVVEQPGRIRAIPAAGGTSGELFLDVKDRVNYGGEKGLLGLALHPNFKKNRRLFVDYTTGANKSQLKTHISEFRVSDDFKTCDPASEKVILEFDQPYENHNGGNIQFGPDGFLYIGNGDGGSGNDPHGNGQNLNTLLGKILRIDVDHKDGDKLYAIPKDNPFAGQPGKRGEIWAYGMRNPWRWSFDRKTGELWCGDVGQNNWEEIDIIEKGKNYGWRIMEGFHTTPGVSKPDADQTGLTMPVIEYGRKEGDKFLGNSVTGGWVYRGKKFPALQGTYIYGDFGSRRICGLRYESGKVTEHRELGMCPQPPSSFGEDAEGELLVVGHGGAIWRLNTK